jgi:hypothetical protein
MDRRGGSSLFRLRWLGLGVLVAACAARESPPPPTTDGSPRNGGAAGGVETVDSVDELGYELHGGIAGFDVVLHVRPASAGGAEAGAQAEVTERGQPSRRGALSPADWQALNQLVAAADLGHVKPAYGQAGAVADAFHEVLNVKRGSASTQVTVISDMADEPPEALRVLLERLRELALTLPPAR